MGPHPFSCQGVSRDRVNEHGFYGMLPGLCVVWVNSRPCGPILPFDYIPELLLWAVRGPRGAGRRTRTLFRSWLPGGLVGTDKALKAVMRGASWCGQGSVGRKAGRG